MKTGRLITLKMLEDADACSSQVKEFKTRFGDSVKVTKKLCESVAQVFGWKFAANHFLSDAATSDFERHSALLQEEYERQSAPLHEEYKRQSAPLWAEYARQITPLWEEYVRQRTQIRQTASSWEELEFLRQIAPLQEKYERQSAPLHEEHERQCAPLWAEYARQEVPLRRKYRRKLAILFWKLYNNDVA